MRTLHVNLVSESAFSVGGHGVHTAFLEHLGLMRDIAEVRTTVNAWRAADVQHVHTVGPIAVAQLLRARRRSVITAHLTPGSLLGSLAGDAYWSGPFMRYVIACYNLAGVVVAVSEHEANELRHLGVRRPIEVIPNTVDVAAVRDLASDPREVRRRYDIPDDRFVVVGVGQTQPRKGLETFLRCADRRPEALFYWVGGKVFGSATADAKGTDDLIRGAGRNVVFTGSLPRTEVIRHLSAADLFFLPSHHENCPMAVLEAAASGLPMVLRNLPQYADLLGDAPLCGADESFPSLIEAVMSDPGLRARLSARSTAVASRFDSKSWVPPLMDLYRDLSSPPLRPSAVDERRGETSR